MKTKKIANKTKTKAAPDKEKNAALAATPTAKPKKAAVKDKFGNREETQAARINAVLTTRPQSIEAITKATSLGKGRVLGHLCFLASKSLVIAGAEGYSVK